MPVSRMRMRPWLEKMIESKCISGLGWVDKEKTMFSIPWKHAARHGWEMDKDACLFKKWAIHTGKYVEGQTCDPKTWKANFRCAMNSLPDIEEVKDRSVNKGQQAMRIFRMLPVSGKSRDRRRKAKAKLTKKNSTARTEEDTDYSDTQSPQSTSPSSEEPTYELMEGPTFEVKDFVPFQPLTFEVKPWKQDTESDSDDTSSGNFNFSDSYRDRFQLSPAHTQDDLPDYICDNFFETFHTFLESQNGNLDVFKILEKEHETSLSSLSTNQSLSDESEENANYTNLDNFVPRLKPWFV